MITPEERAELARIIEGGDYSEAFWRSRWSAARQPSQEDELRAALRASPTDTVQDRRAARKLVEKLNKLAGQKRIMSQAGYANNWTAEQKRLDNLQHAAIYISRANTDFRFFA